MIDNQDKDYCPICAAVMIHCGNCSGAWISRQQRVQVNGVMTCSQCSRLGRDCTGQVDWDNDRGVGRPIPLGVNPRGEWVIPGNSYLCEGFQSVEAEGV